MGQCLRAAHAAMLILIIDKLQVFSNMLFEESLTTRGSSALQFICYTKWKVGKSDYAI